MQTYEPRTDLSAKQIEWCDQHIPHFKTLRQQAEESRRQAEVMRQAVQARKQ